MKKKELLIIFLVSVVFWFASGIVQFFVSYNPTGLASCNLTGYPLAFCFNEFDSLNYAAVIVLNILIWFSVTSVFWKLLKPKYKKG